MPTNDRGSKCTHRYNTVVIVAIVIVRVVPCASLWNYDDLYCGFSEGMETFYLCGKHITHLLDG
jgi:hypothetical protein